MAVDLKIGKDGSITPVYAKYRVKRWRASEAKLQDVKPHILTWRSIKID